MLVIITGVSGTGKTTIGNLLAEKLHLPFFDGDHFHPQKNIDKMSLGHPLSDLDRIPWLEILAAKLIESEKYGGAVLACSGLKESYRQQLAVSQNLRWIHLKGDRSLIWERMLKRQNHYMKASMLDSQLATWEEPEYGIGISIAQSPAMILNKVLDYLVKNPLQMKLGVMGMGVMGKSLALNFAQNGVPIALFNRFLAGKEESIAQKVVDENLDFSNLRAFEDLDLFIQSLQLPRKILLMIPAGEAIDQQLDILMPKLQKGDLVIDGGNSFYKDSEKRVIRMQESGFHFIPMGVSGGEEGARKGPSIMPGGDLEGYNLVKDYLESIAAKDKNGVACVSFVGPGGAGHFVKMVHNSIEYGEMQVLAELVHLLRFGFGCTATKVSSILSDWGATDQKSYLLEITADLLLHEQDGELVVDQILDVAGQKGTGAWSLNTALEYAIPYSPLSEAVNARGVSGQKELRIALSSILQHQFEPVDDSLQTWLPVLHSALRLARIINHEVGFRLMKNVAESKGWDLDFKEIARIWTNGCIIRSSLMEEIAVVYSSQIDFFELSSICESIIHDRKNLASAVGLALGHGFAVPVMSAGINYLLGRITAESSASVIQAQRDYFGAHTYLRKDDPNGRAHHANWGKSD